ncbi:hypothetical protein JOD20_004537 [Herpetosiphon giganteus]|nr:hypothetical protein [Herpetosiphon giganteus]
MFPIPPALFFASFALFAVPIPDSQLFSHELHELHEQYSDSR